MPRMLGSRFSITADVSVAVLDSQGWTLWQVQNVRRLLSVSTKSCDEYEVNRKNAEEEDCW